MTARREEFVVLEHPIAHPDAVSLIGQVQAYYVELYGGPDGTPVDAGEFARPDGAFLVG